MNYSVSVACFAAFLFIVLLKRSDFLTIDVVALSLSNGKKTNGNKSHGNGKRLQQKGFGKIETLDDVLRTYQTRRPDQTNNEQPCPCGVENVSYGDCCYPYHVKLKLPESPLRVLRSRYSAFVYRLIGHIIDTTHPSCRDYRNDKISWAKDLNKNGMFDSVDFISLNITKCGEIEQSCSHHYIDFEVTLGVKKDKRRQVALLPSSTYDKSPSMVRIQERSKFLKENSTGWTYASGVVRSTTNGINDVVFNP